jgi:myo-inositol 2-dehydrogenase/D-chiro-inositol 1-dehydrogenase
LGDEVESVYAVGTSSDEELEERGVIDNATVVMKFLKGVCPSSSLFLIVQFLNDVHSRRAFPHYKQPYSLLLGTVVTLTLSRGANYGYDQRCEIFGTNGMASVKNISDNSTELSNASGIHRPKWQHSFPQRFEAAFGRELDAYADTLLMGKGWSITEEDCVAVQRVCDAALESCESGRVVNLFA